MEESLHGRVMQFDPDQALLPLVVTCNKLYVDVSNTHYSVFTLTVSVSQVSASLTFTESFDVL